VLLRYSEDRGEVVWHHQSWQHRKHGTR